MTDNKLYTVFNVLSGVEKRACLKMLQSPFFNQKADITRLWEWLIDFKKQKKKGTPDSEKGWKWVYPTKPFKSSQWRHLQSQLVQLIDKMLVQGVIQTKNLQTDLFLAPIYRQKKIPLQSVFKRAEERLGKLPKDGEFYHYEYKLLLEKYAAIESSERFGKQNLASINASLDTYLISSKLRLACLMESHRAISNIDYNDPFLELLLPYLKDSPMLDIPIVGLYYYCYKSLSDGTESDFRSFRKTLKEKRNEIPVKEQTTFLLLGINYCIKQLNTGEVRYLQEALDFYQTGIDTKALINDGQISRFAYNNIVALSLKVSKYEWVKNFIEDYTPFLDSKYRETYQNYNLARLYFAKKEYQKAMPMLAQLDDSDLLLNLDSRAILLKIYYETNEHDALDNLMTSFRILLLRNKKKIGYHQKHFLNLLQFIKRMVRLNPHDREAVARFREEVKAKSVVAERDWILSVLED